LLFADSLVSGIATAKEAWKGGSFRIPPPTEQIKDWPLIGGKAYEVWLLASRNITEVLKPFAPQFKTLIGHVFSVLAGAGFALIQFIFSIIIAGVFLAASARSGRAASSLSKRLGDRKGLELLRDAEITVRNVARGILGVALIQAILAGIGFAAAGLPGAGLWALVALILGIVQIGVGPVMIVAVIYLFATASTLTASLFLIWTLLVVPLDNILKPILLGKGAPVPMLVIFLGALGGFFNSGIIGLFVGAVVLSLAYKLAILWVEGDHHERLVD
jgi:predicted PurR-regulated permease PerM